MQHLTLTLDDGSGADYDRLLHGTDGVRVLPEFGDLTLCTKHGALESGRTGVIITFTVQVDGKRYRAQAATPLRQLMWALDILKTAYTEDGMPK